MLKTNSLTFSACQSVLGPLWIEEMAKWLILVNATKVTSAHRLTVLTPSFSVYLPETTASPSNRNTNDACADLWIYVYIICKYNIV